MLLKKHLSNIANRQRLRDSATPRLRIKTVHCSLIATPRLSDSATQRFIKNLADTLYNKYTQ